MRKTSSHRHARPARGVLRIGMPAALMASALAWCSCSNQAGGRDEARASAAPTVTRQQEPTGMGTAARSADPTAPHAASSAPGPESTPVAPAIAEPKQTNDRVAANTEPGNAAAAHAFEDVPLAPMGEEVGRSPLEDAPGYTPPDDPEAAAVRTGRRDAVPVDIPFQGGAASPEDLALAILDGLAAGDRAALLDLVITYDEFREILWPEFPQSRPIVNMSPQAAWQFHHRESNKGLTKGMAAWAGQHLSLRGLSCSVGKMPYTNFTLYKGVVLHAVAESGQPADVTFPAYLVEHAGVWKVYLYKEK